MPRGQSQARYSKSYHNLFYAPKEQIFGNKIVIQGDEFHHIKNVLRKRCGDIIFVTDGAGNRFKAKIIDIKTSALTAYVLKTERFKDKNSMELSLAFVPLKGARNNYIIEKGTELGVRIFFLFLSKFSVIREISSQKLARLRKIAGSAMLQSQRFYYPEFIVKQSLLELVDEFENFDLILVADIKGEAKIPVGRRRVLYIVGPEGGFDENELKMLTKHQGVLISLGMNRLRSETAAIVGIIKILTSYKLI